MCAQEIEQELKERGDEGKEEEGAQDGIQVNSSLQFLRHNLITQSICTLLVKSIVISFK